MKTSFLIALLFFSQLSGLAQSTPEEIKLWKNGAPGFEHKKNIPEKAKDWWVRDIHHPSITLFKPDSPNGMIVLVIPGGGHSSLVYNSEGARAAKYLNKLGITAAILKYRLFREEGSEYNQKHPTEDALGAMRVIRANAKKWKIDGNRVGILAFSAGGEVANWLVFGNNKNIKLNGDDIDKESAKPNFLIEVYPGPLGIPKKVEKDAPPAFLIASNNDECCSETIFDLLKAYRQVKADVEAHFYSKDGHAFNMGNRSEFQSIKGWPERMKDWFADNNYFLKK